MDPVEKIIELAVAEPDFRRQLLEDPAEALRARGISLSPEQLSALQAMADQDMGVVSDEVSERLAKVSEVERSY